MGRAWLDGWIGHTCSPCFEEIEEFERRVRREESLHVVGGDVSGVVVYVQGDCNDVRRSNSGRDGQVFDDKFKMGGDRGEPMDEIGGN